MIEFAVGIVILLTLLSGVIDLTRAFYTYMALRDAAQEGAAYGSICPDDAKISARVRNMSDDPVNLNDTTNVQVDCEFFTSSSYTDCSGTVPAPGNGIKVTVTYNNFKIATPFIGAITGQTITLRGEATEAIMRVTCP